MEAPTDVYMASTQCYVGLFGKFVTVVVQYSQQMMNNTASLNKLVPALIAFLPRVVFNIGVMYGNKEDINPGGQRFGDVIISDAIYGFEYNKIYKNGEKELSSPFHQISSVLLTQLKNTVITFNYEHPAYENQVRIFSGPIMSGSTLLNNSKKKKELFKEFCQPIGIILASSLANIKSEYIIVKGISDWADGFKDSEIDWENFAAMSATEFVYHVLQNGAFFDNYTPKIILKSEEAKNAINAIKADLYTKYQL